MPRRRYLVNKAAVDYARELIAARRYVVRSRWQDAQPTAKQGTEFLKRHDWQAYARWHLGLTEGAAEETKARYAFVVGDFTRLHRMGLVSAVYRALEWEHHEVAKAGFDLLEQLDRRRTR